MRKRIYKNTIATLILFGSLGLSAQKKFNLEREEISLNLAGKTLSGYQTTFDFSNEEVRKGWWRYAKQFGNPLDMRTYYEVKIPAETTDGNIDLVIYSETSQKNGTILFKVGLEDVRYKMQVEELIQDFKKGVYIQYYLGELKIKELEAEKLGNKYVSTSSNQDKERLLDHLNAKKEEMELLKKEIRKVDEK